ncbi:kinase-like domain-containing protein [Cladochytrium replicatum]|nr:kinase-like domain-containing protein [Cladochytrium replicatum]
MDFNYSNTDITVSPPQPMDLFMPPTLSFRPYRLNQAAPSSPSRSQPDTNSDRVPSVKAATKHLLRTYSRCKPDFHYDPQCNPRRVLTKPSKPVHNENYDNEDWDYILYVNDIIGLQEGQQYQILDVLGQGTFGQVVKCCNLKTKELVAVKVIKNKPAYYNQSLVEVAILDMLNNQYDKEDKHHLNRMKDTFLFRNHLCIFRGLSTNLVRVFVSQILDALTVLGKAKIIHCDLKPENILLKNLDSPTIKVIDFGSACHENQTIYTYIQSRFYRSPEVLLGLPYTSSIDMWSLGCIAAELFLGLPLFPGSSEYNQVSRIVEMLGLPPNWTLEKGKASHQFFNRLVSHEGKASWQLESMDQYMQEQGTSEQPSKKYFQGTTLPEVINSYPIVRKGQSQRDLDKEMLNRQSFIDFLGGLLNLNPLERWSPQQAKMHPFITGEKYTGPFTPPLMGRAASRTSTQSIQKSTPVLSGAQPPTAMETSSLGMISAAHSSTSSLAVGPAGTPNLASAPAPSPVIANAAPPIEIGAVVAQTPSRAGRPRASTISSSKVQNIPPQLQRLVAIQQQSGPGKAAVKRGKEKGLGGGGDTPMAGVIEEGSEKGEEVGKEDVVMMDSAEVEQPRKDGGQGGEDKRSGGVNSAGVGVEWGQQQQRPQQQEQQQPHQQQQQSVQIKAVSSGPKSADAISTGHRRRKSQVNPGSQGQGQGPGPGNSYQSQGPW